MNLIAYKARKPDVTPIDGPIVRQRSAHAFGHHWQRARKVASAQDLHLHDLRHDVATRLQNLGVILEVRSALLGHSTKAIITSQYSHGVMARI